MHISEIVFKTPPPAPVRAMTVIPIPLATLAAANTFLALPEVLMAMRMSC